MKLKCLLLLCVVICASVQVVQGQDCDCRCRCRMTASGVTDMKDCDCRCNCGGAMNNPSVRSHANVNQVAPNGQPVNLGGSGLHPADLPTNKHGQHMNQPMVPVTQATHAHGECEGIPDHWEPCPPQCRVKEIRGCRRCHCASLHHLMRATTPASPSFGGAFNKFIPNNQFMPGQSGTRQQGGSVPNQGSGGGLPFAVPQQFRSGGKAPSGSFKNWGTSGGGAPAGGTGGGGTPAGGGSPPMPSFLSNLPFMPGGGTRQLREPGENPIEHLKVRGEERGLPYGGLPEKGALPFFHGSGARRN